MNITIVKWARMESILLREGLLVSDIAISKVTRMNAAEFDIKN